MLRMFCNILTFILCFMFSLMSRRGSVSREQQVASNISRDLVTPYYSFLPSHSVFINMSVLSRLCLCAPSIIFVRLSQTPGVRRCECWRRHVSHWRLGFKIMEDFYIFSAFYSFGEYSQRLPNHILKTTNIQIIQNKEPKVNTLRDPNYWLQNKTFFCSCENKWNTSRLGNSIQNK